MSSETDSENEAADDFGDELEGRASTDSLNELLNDFKTARMSFEPLENWLFVGSRSTALNNDHTICRQVENIDPARSSDYDEDEAASESDSSAVYCDSDAVSENEVMLTPEKGERSDTGLQSRLVSYDNSASDYVTDRHRKVSRFGICREFRLDTVFEHEDVNSESPVKNSAREIDKAQRLNEDVVDNVASDNSTSRARDLQQQRRNAGRRPLSPHRYSPFVQPTFTPQHCKDTANNSSIESHHTESKSRHADLCGYGASAVLPHDDAELPWVNILRRKTKKDYASSPAVADDEENLKFCSEERGVPLSLVESDCSSDDEEKMEKRRQKREHITQELMDTEVTYQRHLELILKFFEDPLRESRIINDHAISAIFGNVREIIGVNRELKQHLSTGKIGQAFLRLGPFLKLYSSYANGHERALATMLDYDQKFPEFAKFRRQQEMVPEMNGLKLNALLITPVQRIPRYRLLLQDLLDNTPTDDPDYDALAEAVRQVSSVARHVNDHIKQQDNFMRMFAIQKSLACPVGPRIIVPGRIFIKEGQLKKVSKRCSLGRSHERTFFLFSDILMYARPRFLDGTTCTRGGVVRGWGGVGNRSSASSPSLVCCCILPLHHCRVEHVFGQCHLSSGGDQTTLFTVVCKQVSLLLYSDQKTVASWIDVLTKAISECQKNRQTLRKQSSCRMPMRRGEIARLWKAEKQSDPLVAALNSPEKPWIRPSETSNPTPSSPSRFFNRLACSPAGNTTASPGKSAAASASAGATESSPNRDLKKQPYMARFACLNPNNHKRRRQVGPSSPKVAATAARTKDGAQLPEYFKR